MKEEIKKFFKGEVEDDEETLLKYSHDASIFEIRPKMVVFPKDSEDVQNLVKWVGDNKIKYPELSITARCAGTDMSGGAIGESIILDFTRHMNKLVSFDYSSDQKLPPHFNATLNRPGETSAQITGQPGSVQFPQQTLDFEPICHCLVLPIGKSM